MAVLTITPNTLNKTVIYASFDPTAANKNWDMIEVGSKTIATSHEIWIPYFKFDLSALSEGAVVTSAELRLFHNYSEYYVDENNYWYAYRVTSPWDGTISYNNQPNSESDSCASLNFNCKTSSVWRVWNVTDIVKLWVNDGASNYGFKLGYSSDGNVIIYDNKDAAQNLPQLVITYDAPPSAPVITSPNGGETISGQHTITWTAGVDPEGEAPTHQLQYSTDNGANWTDIVETAAGVTQYTYDFTNVADSSTCLIRAMAKTSNGGYSAWDQSNGVFTIRHDIPPLAPTQLSPNGSTLDRTQVIRLSWQHNDAESQSKFDLLWSSDNWSTSHTISQVAVNQYVDINSSTFPAGTITWKVRTYDQGSLVGPYSTQAVFTATDPTDAPTITAPVSPVGVSRPVVQWSSMDQVSYQIQVIDSINQTVWDTNEVVSTNKAQTVGVDLANGGTYTVNVRVKGSGGLWSEWASVSITVSYTPPAIPVVTLSGQNGYIQIDITNPTPTGTQPNVTSNDIYRRETGGDWIRIATGLAENAVYNDYAVASGNVYEYHAHTYGDNGTSIGGESKSTSITLKSVWLHDVADAYNTIYNYKNDGGGRKEEWQADCTLVQYDGRTKRVALFGDFETTDIPVTLQMLKSSQDLTMLRALVKLKGTICYRDGRGRKVFGVIRAMPIADEVPWGYTISFTVEDIDYSEVV